MVFKCQVDSYLKEFTTKVVKCEETEEPIVEYGKTINFKGYEVTLEDTILFPAGGGQPHDMGWLDDEEVVQVVRRGVEASHFTRRALNPGAAVHQRVHWPRRLDHMQQHTGQHLLSAILEKEHNIKTESWWLGADESYVELKGPALDMEKVDAVECRCNQLIQQATPVTVKICHPGDPDLGQAHSRGLPADCASTLRVVSIGDVDQNMCCGTHVNNLSHLQVLKVTGMETGKRGNNNLKFLVGNRVINSMHKMLDREKQLTALLKNSPEQHVQLVEKLKNKFKVTNKKLNNVLLELMSLEVDKIKHSAVKPKYLFLFKRETSVEVNRIFGKHLQDENIFLCLLSEDADKPNEGQIILQGAVEDCEQLGNQIAELLSCKGAFKNGWYQGKIGNMAKANKCEQIIKDYFKDK